MSLIQVNHFHTAIKWCQIRTLRIQLWRSGLVTRLPSRLCPSVAPVQIRFVFVAFGKHSSCIRYPLASIEGSLWWTRTEAFWSRTASSGTFCGSQWSSTRRELLLSSPSDVSMNPNMNQFYIHNDVWCITRWWPSGLRWSIQARLSREAQVRILLNAIFLPFFESCCWEKQEKHAHSNEFVYMDVFSFNEHQELQSWFNLELFYQGVKSWQNALGCVYTRKEQVSHSVMIVKEEHLAHVVVVVGENKIVDVNNFLGQQNDLMHFKAALEAFKSWFEQYLRRKIVEHLLKVLLVGHKGIIKSTEHSKQIPIWWTAYCVKELHFEMTRLKLSWCLA